VKAQAGTPQPATALAADSEPLPGTSKPPALENPQPAPTGELAFAARVQPEPAASATGQVPPQLWQHDGAAPAPTFAKKSAESDAGVPAAVTPVTAGAGASLASYGQGPETQPGAALPAAEPSETSPPSPVEAKWIAEAQPKSAAAPVKDIALQVSQPGAQKVDIRVVQQSGEVRVAVRTGDSDLAHGLQDGLSDLVGRLQDTGYRAEAWRPGGPTVQSTPVVGSGASPSGSRNADSQSFAGGSQQQPGERRQNQPQQRPAWVEEMDNSLASGERSQGASYGIGS
jgi:hypothetical protein